MAFSSMIFLCLFLPLFLLIYWRAGTIERRNRVLLAFSLIFYVFGGVGYLILLLIMTAVVWRIGLLIGEFKEEGDGRSAGMCLAAGTAICLAVLGVFKYTGFFVSTFTLGKAIWPMCALGNARRSQITRTSFFTRPCSIRSRRARLRAIRK